MTAQVLDRTVLCYRIGDPQGTYPVYSAGGSRVQPGRWNTEDTPIIYAAEHLSLAMLEKLAGGSGDPPPNQHWVTITIPAGVTYEVLDQAQLRGWDDAKPHLAQAHGAAWVLKRRSAILFVPSVVCRTEQNVLINPTHSDFPRISASLHRPVIWDSRLFRA